MAIRYREDRKSWQVYWNNPLTGKREQKSFKTQAEAEKENAAILNRLQSDRGSFLDKGMAYGKTTLNDAFLRYLREKQFSMKMLSWQQVSMKFFLKKFGKLCLDEITKPMISAAQMELLETDLKPVTVRDRMKVLRTLLRWAADRELCDPIQFPKIVSATYEQFVPPTVSEIAAIYKMGSPMVQRVVLIGSQCGVRVGPSELFRLKWQDVDFDASVLKVHGAKKNKNALWRDVPIRGALLPLMCQWYNEDNGEGYIIHNDKGEAVNSIQHHWKAALDAAGITRRIRPYDLRHSFATESIAAGADIGTIAKIMGHANANMILSHYQYVMTNQKRAAVECLPSIPDVF